MQWLKRQWIKVRAWEKRNRYKRPEGHRLGDRTKMPDPRDMGTGGPATGGPFG
jgi:hypothetical protein